jgi:hypothetical protein
MIAWDYNNSIFLLYSIVLLTFITSICVTVHFAFHLISNKLEQIYHGERSQFPSKQGSIFMDK